jgi:hypothetical protein
MADRSVSGSIGLFVLVKCCRTHDLRLFLIRTFALLSWKIDDFVDEVGGKNGTADYADYTDF